jgi:membrane protein DedA with SNARE-associated domain
MEWINTLFEQYGYLVLFLGLFAESVAIPFPGELAMAVSGHMSTIGSFTIPLVIAFSYFGAVIGTAFSYFLGYKLGTPFFERNGRYFFLNQERIAKITKWFDKYGDKIILISYFVPGLRHFTGYVSGILKVRVRTFFIYNCIGGLAWVLTYVMVGKLFGWQIERLLHTVANYSLAAAAVFILAAVTVVLARRRRRSVSQ